MWDLCLRFLAFECMLPGLSLPRRYQHRQLLILKKLLFTHTCCSTSQEQGSEHRQTAIAAHGGRAQSWMCNTLRRAWPLPTARRRHSRLSLMTIGATMQRQQQVAVGHGSDPSCCQKWTRVFHCSRKGMDHRMATPYRQPTSLTC